MKSITIRFFKSYTKEAEVLLNMVKDEIPAFILSKTGIESKVIIEESKGLLPENGKQASAFNVLQSALNNEIVIIDASIEQTDEHELGQNYECITPAVSSLDNVLVVSRTELPLNLIPCRSNVAPLGQNDMTDNCSIRETFGDTITLSEEYKPHNDLTTYKKEYSNEYIIAWVKYVLLKMHKNCRLEREGFSSIDVSNPSNDLFEREMEIMSENIEAIKKEKGNRKKSFISYRSIYYSKDENSNTKKYCGKYNVADVVRIINEYHKDPSHKEWEKPFFYPNGVLSNELMPEIRRWAFIAMPDRVIREADEFWIFETKQKRNKEGKITEFGYWDSWWCLGEFITIIRMKYSGQLKEGFKLMVFDPDINSESDLDKIVEIPYRDIPTMTDEQNRELARYFANGDFLEAGYESMGNMRAMGKKPKLIRWFYFQLLKRFVWPKVMSPEDVKDFKFKYYNDSVKSHVYEEEFMTNRILVDDRQERGITRKEVFNDKDIIWRFLNVNGCYSKTKKIDLYPGSSIIKKEEEGILKKTDKHFYLLWTPRMSKRTGPNDCILEKVPLYTYINKK